MRKLLQLLLTKPLTWMGNYLSSAPDRDTVFKSLSDLYNTGIKPNNKSCIILDADAEKSKFIIFSDQHKGNKTWSDDFKLSIPTYIEALNYYNSKGYQYINLGDCEELWKFKADDILHKNMPSLAAEGQFQPDRYHRTFGNHDLMWKNALDVQLKLNKYFPAPLTIREGIILRIKVGERTLEVFLTHGHQGDMMSDNNAVSTWIVAHIWMPIQRYLRLNINAPSKNYSLRNKHNLMMHEWSSSRPHLVLITGHTHRPVFASGRYYDHPNNDMREGNQLDKECPAYFNTGCCCFADGDITGIEISEGNICLIKWTEKEGKLIKKVLETVTLKKLMLDMDEC